MNEMDCIYNLLEDFAHIVKFDYATVYCLVQGKRLICLTINCVIIK